MHDATWRRRPHIDHLVLTTSKQKVATRRSNTARDAAKVSCAQHRAACITVGGGGSSAVGGGGRTAHAEACSGVSRITLECAQLASRQNIVSDDLRIRAMISALIHCARKSVS